MTISIDTMPCHANTFTGMTGSTTTTIMNVCLVQ